MNGVHDLGGMHGFGPVRAAEKESAFAEAWEGEVFAAVIAMMAQGVYNIDEFRHAIERMDGAHYLSSSYFEHWLAALQTMLQEKGVLSEAEIAERLAAVQQDPDSVQRPEPGSDDPLAAALAQGAATGLPSERPSDVPARFKVGEAVHARVMHPAGHTRLPRYVRGHDGVIERVHGAFIFPDAHAHGHGEQPQYLYSVRFDGGTLWGESAEAAPTTHCIDLWESYLQPR